MMEMGDSLKRGEVKQIKKRKRERGKERGFNGTNREKDKPFQQD